MWVTVSLGATRLAWYLLVYGRLILAHPKDEGLWEGARVLFTLHISWIFFPTGHIACYTQNTPTLTCAPPNTHTSTCRTANTHLPHTLCPLKNQVYFVLFRWEWRKITSQEKRIHVSKHKHTHTQKKKKSVYKLSLKLWLKCRHHNL